MSINVILLSRRPDLYASKRIIEAADKYPKINLINIDPARVICQINVDQSLSISIPGFSNINLMKTVVIPRISSICPEHSIFVLQHLEACGCISIASSESIWIARNKYLTLLKILKNNGNKQFEKIVPASILLKYDSDIESEVKRLGGYPVILKYIRGTSGAGVILAPDQSSIKANLAALNQLHYDLMIQKYYPEAKEHDIRLIVLGDRVIASMKRKPTKHEFRANFHQGASLEYYQPSSYEKSLALSLAQQFDFKFCGVDLIGTRDGIKVLEINSSPGFEGIEQVNETTIAEQLLGYIESEIKEVR